MLHRIVAIRLMPVAASVAIHVALAGSVFLLPAWTAPRESVIVLELIEPDAPAAPVAPPPPPKRDPRPVTPPKPIATPMPAPPPPIAKPEPVEKPAEPEPPRVETPPDPPKPAVEAPAQPMPRVATAPSVTLPQTSSPPSVAQGRSPDSTFTVTEPQRPSVPTTPANQTMASLPSDGITRRAIPRGTDQARPNYPASAQRRGIQGTTLLEVLVAADGRVAEVVVKESAGHPDLDSAAAEAVRRWRFEPARRGNEAVAMRVLQPIEFKLK